MTDFERQVAEAMGPRCAELLLPITVVAQKLGRAGDVAAITKCRAELGAACDALYDGLAARVAAAGNLLARELGEEASGERGNPTDPDEPERFAERYRRDFLAALRGEANLLDAALAGMGRVGTCARCGTRYEASSAMAGCPACGSLALRREP